MLNTVILIPKQLSTLCCQVKLFNGQKWLICDGVAYKVEGKNNFRTFKRLLTNTYDRERFFSQIKTIAFREEREFRLEVSLWDYSLIQYSP